MVRAANACYVWRHPWSRLHMHALIRCVSRLALCAGLALTACKDNSSGPPAQPPAEVTPPGDASPAAPPPGDASVGAPSAGDATPPSAGPTDPGTGASVLCTPDTRKGGICTREYRPVCGSFQDATARTFSNKCAACSDEKVVRYVDGPCPGDAAH